MAYETGSAATMADLRAALSAFLTANGWTLSGAVFHKGGCYVSVSAEAARLVARGGTGESSGSLSGPGPQPVYCGSPLTGVAMAFPLTYHFHTHGDEAWAFINWSDHYWGYLGFGCSPVAGLPGSGSWYTASTAGTPLATLQWGGADYYHGGLVLAGTYNATGPFWAPGNTGHANSYVHHGLDSGSWSAATGTSLAGPGPGAQCLGTAGPLLVRSPNAWNGEAVLIPMQPYIARPSSKVSIIAELQSARFVNMANLPPQEVLTLGPDRWRVYPFFRKGTAAAPTPTDSGPLGLAVRYDGP